MNTGLQRGYGMHPELAAVARGGEQVAAYVSAAMVGAAMSLAAELRRIQGLTPTANKEGKAHELQRLNDRDPAWRAKNGLPPLMDALTQWRGTGTAE
jgi:hypothetical protein